MSSLQNGMFKIIARLIQTSFFIHSAEIITQRKGFERISNFTKFPRFVKYSSIEIVGLNAVNFLPKKSNKDRIVLYLHGGAYVVGSVKTHRALIARIARAAKCSAIGIDYRLAPEHPFPAALNDSLAAYKALLSNGHQNIFLVGDSAGGGLALSTIIKIREEGLPMPSGAVLISPWTDLAFTGESIKSKEHVDPLLNSATLNAFAKKYIGENYSDNPLISPLYDDLREMPPIFIQVGGNEILVDDSTRLAKKLKKAGCNVQLEIWEDMFHVWHYLGGLIPESQEAIKKIGIFIKNIHTQSLIETTASSSLSDIV